MKDLQHQFKYEIAIPPQESANNMALQSAVLDRQGCTGATEFVVHFGAIGASGSSYEVTLTDGAESNGGDQAAVAAGLILDNLPTVEGSAGNDQTVSFGYVGGQRYLQLTITPAGNTGSGAGTFVSATMIMEMRGQPTSGIQI